MRRLVCTVIGHRWQRQRYPDADAPNGYFLRCARCAREKEAPERAVGAWLAGGGGGGN